MANTYSYGCLNAADFNVAANSTATFKKHDNFGILPSTEVKDYDVAMTNSNMGTDQNELVLLKSRSITNLNNEASKRSLHSPLKNPGQLVTIRHDLVDRETDAEGKIIADWPDSISINFHLSRGNQHDIDTRVKVLMERALSSMYSETESGFIISDFVRNALVPNKN